MRLGRLLASLSLSAALVGCVNLDLTDPNEPSTDTFWQTPAQAVAGVNAVYNALENNGTYGRWLVFATDAHRSSGHGQPRRGMGADRAGSDRRARGPAAIVQRRRRGSRHLGRGDGVAR